MANQPGRDAEAEQAYRDAAGNTEASVDPGHTLADSERVLGPDHPNTLTSRNNLAGAYQAAGDVGRAIPLYEAALADSERVLGPDHPNTLTSRNNLAGAYQAAGDV
ncbi:tetratricopeptide repeat protein, partial [Amycolatopsis coloradensis]|uniref:tetratricopeptide repeat protein n=1 Tax=Amycolatopsis coloradensis TaxID=76021 RepID=UPI0033E6D4E2